jgi:hypothetical protein
MSESSTSKLINALSTSPHWEVNKSIAQEVGVNAAIILAEFKNQVVGEDGTFFVSTQYIEQELGISRYDRLTSIKALVGAGYLKVHRRGLPCKNFYEVIKN